MQVGPRQHVNLSVHSRCDALELAFTKVADCPPGARVNQCEQLLAHVGIGAFRNCEIRYTSIEWCVNATVAQIVTSLPYCRRLCSTLVDERLERGDGLVCLLGWRENRVYLGPRQLQP